MTSAPIRERTLSPLGALERHGDAPALVSSAHTLGHAELAERARARAAHLGPGRRLVLLRCRNDVETVVTYLAALHGGHPLILTGPDGDDGELRAAYRPDVVAAGPDLETGPLLDRRFHPDLALLLSTSGSTGSPKLVRLSRENVRSNAQSIADYLTLTADDRAATTLPLQYCYGLSVLNSHLLVGASALLTEDSVVDERFWQDFNAAGATSFAGVPHTFDLLESSGFEQRDLPSLRTVTQAGGRLPAEQVRRFAGLGRRVGFDFVVMYGQTEATARMAYLPAHLAQARPTSIGIPIPGGSLRLDPCGHPDEEVGELVYSGPNVMLGYAEKVQDLALGRTVHELRTGDLGRQSEDGLFEVVGRRSRFAKVFGLRVDLDRIEEQLRERQVEAFVVEHQDGLHAFASRSRDLRTVAALVAGLGLPAHVLHGHLLARLPRTAHGKPDRAALRRHLAATPAPVEDTAVVTPERVRDLFAVLLGRPDATVEDSFVSLDGDSLSYVEVSLRLGALLPELPVDWRERSAAELAALAAAGQRTDGLVGVETSVLLRALAIVLIVGTHANLLSLTGGAHVLLAVAGFNLARFQLSGQPRCRRRRSLLRTAAAIAVPSALWIGGVTLVAGTYDAPTALLLNNALGAAEWDVRWQFWFLEAFVWFFVGVAVVLLLPRVDQWERAAPFGFATAVCAAALTLRYALVGVEAGHPDRYALLVVAWTLTVGWMAARAGSTRQRLLTSVVAVLACWGFFGDPLREGVVAAGMCLLIWVPRLPMPAFAVPALRALAGSSLFVYLTHWQVYPHLEVDHPVLATVASFVVGYAVWRCWVRLGVFSAGSPGERSPLLWSGRTTASWPSSTLDRCSRATRWWSRAGTSAPFPSSPRS